MRILLISHFPLVGSGSGFYTKNIAKSLVKLGHEVCVIISENTTEIEKIEGVTIEPVLFNNDNFIDNSLPFNFPCFTTHPRSNITFDELDNKELKIYEESFEKKIEETIRTFKPDVINAQHIWIVSSIASKFNIPTIITSHGTDIIGYNSWNRFRKYSKEAVERCNKIITISESNNEQVTKIFNKAQEKVVCISNGYDQETFYKKSYNKEKILKQIGINEVYKNVLLFSGKLVEVKGVDILLRAAKIYEKEDILTIICGEGVLHEELEKLAKHLNLKNVVFIGNQSQKMLNKLYNIADATILSSRYEGLPLTVLESLACGTPVVVTDIDSMKKFMKKEFGIMVQKENPDELAKGIIEFLSEKQHFNSDKLAKYMKENYAQDVLTNKIVEVYKSCIQL